MQRFHFILTQQLSLNYGAGSATRSLDGTVDVRPGETRGQVYKRLKEETAITEGYAGTNDWSSAVTIFFSLEPEDFALSGPQPV